MKKEKILFFIKGFVPTDEERAEAEKLGTKMFRSARMVSDTSPIEKCDCVYGCVPEQYEHLKKESVEVEQKPKKTKSEPVGKPPVWIPN